MGRIKDAWDTLRYGKDAPAPASQFLAPMGVGYTSYSQRTVQNVTQIGYMNNITVYRAVNVLAQSIANIKWYVKKKYGQGERLLDHPLAKLIEQPSLKRARSSYMEQLVSYLIIGGANYTYAVTANNDLRPLGLYNLRPDLMAPIYGPGGVLTGYRYNTQEPKDYPLDQIHALRFFHPFDELAGLSPLMVAAAIIERQNAGEEWNFNLMSNMARPSGAFVSTVDLPPLTRGKLVQEIKKKYGRGRQTAGMPLLLENGLSYIQLALSPVDADWLSSDESAGRKLATAIGVDSLLLNDKAQSTYNNVSEAKVAMWELTAGPLLSKIEDEYNMWLPPRYGDDVIMVADRGPIELLKKNQSLSAQITLQTWNSGLASFNSSAEELAQPLLPEKDDFFKFGPTLFVRKSEVSKWLDMQEERRNAPPVVPVPPSPQRIPQTVVTEVNNRLPALSYVKAEQGEIESLRETYSADFAEKLRRFFHTQYKNFADVFRSNAITPDDAVAAILSKIAIDNEELSALLTYQYMDVGEAAAKRIGAQFGIDATIYTKASPFSFAKYIAHELGLITDSTHSDVLRLGGVENIDALKSAMQNMYQGYEQDRALLIAQNETILAGNVGSYIAAAQVGIPLLKTWQCVDDTRSREWHKEAEGQVRSLVDPYDVGGEKLLFPKDLSQGASSSNVVNCRCFEIYSVDFALSGKKLHEKSDHKNSGSEDR